MKCPSCSKSFWFFREQCPFCRAPLNLPPRPKSVKVVSLICIAMGCFGLLALLFPGAAGLPPHLADLKTDHPGDYALMYARAIIFIFLALFTMLGHNWARWLLAGFLAWRVVFSIWHGAPIQAAFSFVLTFTVAYYLFRPLAKPFFRSANLKTENLSSPTTPG
jgi:hypothetical protein